jgi:flagellar hook-length control protein FliK
MGQLMANLDLDQAGEAKASALYQDLLKTTGDSLMNERLAGLDKSVNFDVVSPRDHSLRKLSSSLDDMNNAFFKKEMADPKSAQKSLDAMDVALAQMMAQPQAQAEAGKALNVDAESGIESAGGDSSEGDLLAALGAVKTQPGALAQAKSKGESDLADLLGHNQEEASSVKPTKENLKSAFAEEISKVDKGEKGAADSALKPDVNVDQQAILAQDSHVAPSSSKSVLAPADMIMGKQPTAKDEQENVKELIRQAQIMVKRGGGEMKMEMKPEGMGSIHLRVNVENGQVNVQMLTETESAKHLLEKGLHELKSNLAQHELKVQSMTVDVGNDVKSQMDQQATQDQQRQKAQQLAQDFMGGFRDEQQGFRQGFLENKGWKSYARGKGPDSIQPEQVERAATASRGDNSKRLNLVA